MKKKKADLLVRILLFIIALMVFAPEGRAQEATSSEQVSAEKTEKPLEEPIKKKNLLGALRGFVWGLSRTVILEHEEGTFMGEENGSLFYLDYIRGLKSTIGYEFKDEKLWRARIFIEKKYIDVQEYIDDLLMISEDLTKRFGEPVAEEMKWLDKTEQNFPEKWGWAVYRGELIITMVWQDAETLVTVYLGAPKRYKPEFNITYEDRKAKAEVQKDKKKGFLRLP